jgi:hypothetical protein
VSDFIVPPWRSISRPSPFIISFQVAFWPNGRRAFRRRSTIRALRVERDASVRVSQEAKLASSADLQSEIKRHEDSPRDVACVLGRTGGISSREECERQSRPP